MEEDIYQSQIDNYLADIKSVIPRKSMYITHLLLGDVASAGKIRRSSIDFSNSYLGINQKNTKNSHEHVFQNYIKIHDRKSTFLNYIENLIKKKKVKKVIIEVTNKGDFSIELDPKPKGSELKIKYVINDSFVQKLIPESANEYFDELYNKDKIDFKKWSKTFLIARAKAFQYCIESDCFKNEINESIENILWENLIAIQSLILYLKFGSKDCNKYTGTAYFKVHKWQSPILISGVIITDNGDDIIKTIMANQFESGELIQLVNNSIGEIKHDLATFKKNISDEIDSIFSISLQKFKSINTILWLMHLLKILDKEIHEGKELDFYFVLGDKSEFEDHNNIIFKSVNPPEFENFDISDDNNIEELTQDMAYVLSKEHYPWFERGRCGLFWDVSCKSFKPIALVTIKGASWEQIAEDRYRDVTNIEIPPSIIVYKSSVIKESAIIKVIQIIEENNAGQLLNIQKIKEIAKKKDNVWNFYNNKIEDEIKKKVLEKIIAPYKQIIPEFDDWLDKIIYCITQIANNPNRGGSLVVCGEDLDIEKLLTMGKYWEKIENLTNDDIIALISHDGASLIKINNDNWYYRHLLTPPGYATDFFNFLINKSKSFPLRSTGSRRWNTAMSALNKDVLLSIAISQDGDIHFWHFDEELKEHLSVKNDYENINLNNSFFAKIDKTTIEEGNIKPEPLSDFIYENENIPNTIK